MPQPPAPVRPLTEWLVLRPRGRKPIWAGLAEDGEDALRRARDAGRELPAGSRAEGLLRVDLSKVPARRDGKGIE